MQPSPPRIPKLLITLFMVAGGLCGKGYAQNQGKVIINEYMSNGTSTTSGCPQFIELINLGPGPQDISCYIISTEKNTITIPQPTILQPGQIYLIAGVASYPRLCVTPQPASNPPVDLNWTTCNNCGSGTGNFGSNDFMTVGNNSNSYPMVLMDKDKKVLDAVRNTATMVPLTNITTGTSSGCATTTVNLGTASVTYETYTAATGKENSYSRIQNGSCDWEKTPAISPGVNNNLSAISNPIAFNSSYQATCNGVAASFTFTSTGGSTLFPLSYIILYDPNPLGDAGDGNNDTSWTRTNIQESSTASNTFTISPLAGGDYRILIEPASGCNQVVTDFYIPFGTYTNTTFLTESSCDVSGKGRATITIMDARSTEVFPMTYTLTTSTGTYTTATATQTMNGSWPALVLSNLDPGTYTMTFKPKEACDVSTTSFYVPLGTYSYTLTPSNVCAGGQASVAFTTGTSAEIFPLTYSYTTPQGATVTGTVTSESTAGGLPDFVLTGLTAGTYSLTFTPLKACLPTTTSFAIYSGVYTHTIVTIPSCTANSGEVIFEFSSGTQAEIFPMTYNLITPSGTLTGTATPITTAEGRQAFEITGLAVGTYSITFSPAQACTSSTSSFTISNGVYPASTVKQYQSGCNLANVTFFFEGVTTDRIIPLTYTITANEGGTYSNTTYNDATYTNNFPSFVIENLPLGQYSIVFNLNNACQSNTSSFTLAVNECTTLGVTLKKVTGKNLGNLNEFNLELDAGEILKELSFESSPDGKTFSKQGEIPFENKKGIQYIRHTAPVNENNFFRFSLLDIYSRLTYSAVLRISSPSGNIGINVSPNPFGNTLRLTTFSAKEDKLNVQIRSANGAIVQEHELRLRTGQNTLTLGTSNLPSGYYFISMKKSSVQEVQTSALIRQ